MNIVCLDTQIVIWGIKGEAIPEQQHMIPKAKHLLEKCEEERVGIMIPSIVVAELLSGLEPQNHNAFCRALQKNFIIPPFDVKAATQYAKIWRAKKQVRSELSKQKIATRSELKADCLIVATAIASKATCLYSHDGPLKKFAQDFIDTRDLPELPPVQTSFKTTT